MDITVEQMMAIENRGHGMGFLKKFMMENAGAAAVRRLVERRGDPASKQAVILAGIGNNGGDGMVMARHLAGRGAQVTVALLGGPESIKTEESRWNWELLEKMPSVSLAHGMIPSMSSADIIIDAVLGTGITGDVRSPYSDAISAINKAGGFVLAVDVPSGLDPGTGKEANMAVKADMTVTFHKMKRGMPKREDLCGDIYVEQIGIPPEAEAGIL